MLQWLAAGTYDYTASLYHSKPETYIPNRVDRDETCFGNLSLSTRIVGHLTISTFASSWHLRLCRMALPL